MSEIVTLAERPDLLQAALELLAVGWPEFVQHDAAQDRYLPRLIDDIAAFQVLLVDPDGGRLRALGASIPFAWDGTTPGLPAGWDAVVQQGVADLDAGREPTAAAGLSITVAPDQLGQGLSGQVIQAQAGGRRRRRPGRDGRAGPPHPQERLPAHAHGALRPLDQAGRHPVRPLAAHPRAPGSSGSARSPC